MKYILNFLPQSYNSISVLEASPFLIKELGIKLKNGYIHSSDAQFRKLLIMFKKSKEDYIGDEELTKYLILKNIDPVAFHNYISSSFVVGTPEFKDGLNNFVVSNIKFGFIHSTQCLLISKVKLENLGNDVIGRKLDVYYYFNYPNLPLML